MFIPELLPRSTRRLHRRTFFGDSHCKPFAILTPIKAIFDELGIDEPNGGGGWWPCKFLANTLVVLTPQGPPAIDALCALEPGTRVMFVGLTGALGGLSCGDIVEPSSAMFGVSEYSRTSLTPFTYPKVTVATVTSLNESLQEREVLRQRADCVDMETAWLFSIAQRQSRDVKVVLIVSDHLFSDTFVDTPLALITPAIRRFARDICSRTFFIDSAQCEDSDVPASRDVLGYATGTLGIGAGKNHSPQRSKR